MHLTRYTNRHLARLLIGLVVLAQGFVTTNVYAAPDAGRVQAVAALAEHESMPCHEESGRQKPAHKPGHTPGHTKDASAASGCITHCSLADLINADHAVQLAAPAGSLKISVPPVRQASAGASRQYVVVDTGPPLSIRFCSFLI